jgi:TP901 family phage tail tape measure protein
MDGKSKIELVLELKNRMKTGLTKAKESVNSNVTAMKERLSNLKNHHVAAFKAMRDEVPMLGRAFALVGNPYTMIIAGAIALGATLYTAGKKASEFHAAFLPIKQLNLDKSSATLRQYQNQIKDAAYNVGADLNKATSAFYDLQSGTGLFGQDAVDVFEKVGKYSLVTGADINDSMNSTVKAMRAFGLSVKDIDSLLISNAKTVQMGITTFDELARVQTEYAGAAKGAGQNVDTANKLFAAFTSIAKDANIAANMTKTAFQGLTQKQTIDGLQSIGISMYDANGNMRDMATILKDVSQKFKTMSSAQIDGLINKIGGPEGLRSMFVKLKTSGDDFFNTLNGFDNSTFNFEQAMANAMNDFATLKSVFWNRLNIVLTRLGEKILPVLISGLNAVIKIMDFFEKGFTKGKREFITYNQALETIGGTYDKFKTHLAKTQSEAISLFEALKRTNPGTETRRALINKINQEYGSYLPNLLTEKSTLLEIAAAQDAVTRSIRNQLAMKAKEEKINAIVQSQMQREQDWLKNFVTDSTPLSSWIAGLEEFTSKQALLLTKDGIVQQRLLEAENLSTMTGFPLKTIVETFRQLNKLREDDKRAIKSYSDLYSSYFDESAAATGGGVPTGGTGGAGGSGSSDVTSIAGSAKQIKHITINIDSFNKGGINTQNTTLQNMNPQQIEEWFNNMLLRVIRNVETSY